VQCYIFGAENTISATLVPAPAVKNLIFDLGGVILDLSVDHTLQSFAKLSNLPAEKVKKIFIETPEFEQYEKGLLNDQQFRKFVCDIYNIQASDTDIDASWNAMLRGIPLVKLQLLQKLKENYRVFLLSNTNGIHLHFINEVILKDLTGNTVLDDYFHKAYYSHRMLKRKPEPEIFHEVLDENSLKAEETLFLDDNALNIEGAKAVGIATIYVNTANHILDVFNE
jgi:glucose-1-phosphatase